MDRQSIRQIQGAAELLGDATAAASAGIGATHAQAASVPYAVLRRVPLVRKPAGRIETIQSHITVAVYQSILAISTLSVLVITQALSALEHHTAEE